MISGLPSGLAQHLARAFQALEVELNFLSRPETVGQVQLLLEKLRSQLNASQECFARVVGAHCVAFSVRHQGLALPRGPGLSQVPMPLVDLSELSHQTGDQSLQPSFELDGALLHLVRYVDGVRSTQQIAEVSGLGTECARCCLQHLQHFGLIAIIDPIRPESRYCLTPEFHVVFERPEIVKQAALYCCAGHTRNDTGGAIAAEALAQVIQGLYADMDGRSESLEEFQQAHEEEMTTNGISLRHFVTFGLLRGFLEPLNRSDRAAALSESEMNELQLLRSSTWTRKAKLKEEGLKAPDVNKDPEVQAMVTRMNELKAKEKIGASVDSADDRRSNSSSPVMLTALPF